MSENEKVEREYPVKVSVFCLVYNHEKYLRKCLDGFVMQKTDFPFEVLINDDASTDSSAEILREYEAKYPHLFRVFYQEKNLYSQKIGVNATILYPAARGKYTAFCEGDDFWTDPLKLQKQVDALESHPNCHICMHRVVCCEENGTMTEKTIPPFPLEEGVLTSEIFLRMFAKKHFVHLCSYMVETRFWHKYYPPLDPEHQQVISPFGDTSCVMFFACMGNLYYIDETMSCHRMASVEGWTIRFNRAPAKEKVARKEKILEMARKLDAASEYRYHDALAEWIFDKQCFIADVTGDFKPLVKGENRKILRSTRSFRFRFRVWSCVLFPHFAPRLFRWYFKKKGISLGEIRTS